MQSLQTLHLVGVFIQVIINDVRNYEPETVITVQKLLMMSDNIV